MRDRLYILAGGKTPLTYQVKSNGILYFDEEAGFNREIRYATNQRSLFRDEQDDHVRLGHVIFTDGSLMVSKNDVLLQKLLSIYHPNKHRWIEIDNKKKAIDEVDYVEFELEAMNLANELDVEHLEAILRTEIGSSVSRMSSKELKRDAYRLARYNPELFITLANDEDIKLRNLANRAVEANILELTDNNTVFRFASNHKKVMTVPFEEHPYIALAKFFKTDEGVDLMKSITKKLS